MVGEAEIWKWLEDVPDPEIPAISVVDLGIVRAAAWRPDATLEVTITPTYSGCPAISAIARDIEATLHAHGIAHVTLTTRLAPAWTTACISARGREKLRAFGIAPPAAPATRGAGRVDSAAGLPTGPVPERPGGADHREAAGAKPPAKTGRACGLAAIAPAVACPHCGSHSTECISAFGSTACKALYRCRTCREPFDYFKPLA